MPNKIAYALVASEKAIECQKSLIKLAEELPDGSDRERVLKAAKRVGKTKKVVSTILG